MPLNTEVHPQPISNSVDLEDNESDSSEEDDGRFGFWGASGSSASLSKYLAKREKEAERDLKKQIAKRDIELKKEANSREFETKKSMEDTTSKLQKSSSSGDVNRNRSSEFRAPSTDMVNGPSKLVDEMRHSNSNQRLPSAIVRNSSHSNHDIAQQMPKPESVRSSVHDVRGSQVIQNAIQLTDYVDGYSTASRDSAVNHVGFTDNPPTVNYIPNGYIQQQPVRPDLARQFFQGEPDLPDEVQVSKIIRRIGAYRNWSEREIQSDLIVLEAHRLRTVKDLRDLTLDGWKEIHDLIPLVKDLLVKEINRGHNSAPQSRGFDYSHSRFDNFSMFDLKSGRSYGMADSNSNYDLKNAKAPVSTPVDTPDFNASRKTFNPRGANW